MSGRSVVSGFVIFALLACGGRAEDSPEPGGGAGHAGTTGGRFGAGGGGAGGSAANAGLAGSGVAGRYVDPGCPSVAPPPALVECDPLDPVGTCPSGEGCYPFVDHPFGRGCDVATYGAICVRVGRGVQGDPCGADTPGCAAGYMCVVGSRSGRRCARICTFDGPDTCPSGMICGETDVQGYGVCN